MSKKFKDISHTAKGGGYYHVYDNDSNKISQHSAEREALETASQLALENPNTKYYITHDYLVEVIAVFEQDGEVQISSSSSSSSDSSMSSNSSDSSQSELSDLSSASSDSTAGVVGPTVDFFIHVSPNGDDSNDGMFPVSAVATADRAKEIVHENLLPFPNANYKILYERNHEYPSFGRFTFGNVSFHGTPEQYFVVGAYGDGARPILSGHGIDGATNTKDLSAFRLWYNKNIEVRDIHVQGGKFVDGYGSGTRGFRMVNCVAQDAGVLVQAKADSRYTEIEILNSVLYDMVRAEGDGSAIFLSRCDQITVTDTVMYRNGWFGAQGPATPDEDLVVSNRNHGIYITGDCQVDAFDRNICIFNSGAGAQVRPGGNTRDNFFAWNGRTGLDWGLTNGQSSLDDIPGSGECSGNYVYATFGTGIGTDDMLNAKMFNNTVLCAEGSLNKAYGVRAFHGPNEFPDKGGQRFGMNNMEVYDNIAANGRFFCSEGDGWGIHPDADYGVNIHDNILHEEILTSAASEVPANTFGPNNIIDPTHHQSMIIPERTETLIDNILNQRITAAELIAQYTT